MLGYYGVYNIQEKRKKNMRYTSHIQGRAIVDIDKLKQHQVDKDKIRQLADLYTDIYASLDIVEDELIFAQISADWSEIFDYEVDIVDIIDDLKTGVIIGQCTTDLSYGLEDNLKKFVDNYGDILTSMIVDRKGEKWDDFEQFKMVKDSSGARLESCQAEVVITYNDWRAA